MKDTIKFVIMNFFIITVGVLFVISLGNLLAGVEYYPAEYPWMVMLTGAITALPALIFHTKKDISKKQLIIRFVVHFFVVGAIVLFLGYIWEWYETFGYAVIVFLMYIFVYALVTAYSYFIPFRDAKTINEALKRFNSDENNQQ